LVPRRWEFAPSLRRRVGQGVARPARSYRESGAAWSTATLRRRGKVSRSSARRTGERPEQEESFAWQSTSGTLFVQRGSRRCPLDRKLTTPALTSQGRVNLFPTRTAVEHLLSDLLSELRRRGDRLLDVKQVTGRTTLARNTIWELERAGNFPRRRQITANKVAWLESEIDAWIASRPTAQQARDERT
jgi:prophage regulatory protein